ncbi:MAG: WG repeat-containing protein, partial [Desulfobacterales bacterium]|nr:WG repeat-containing protein [Desulfobacterales bacterium]
LRELLFDKYSQYTVYYQSELDYLFLTPIVEKWFLLEKEAYESQHAEDNKPSYIRDKITIQTYILAEMDNKLKESALKCFHAYFLSATFPDQIQPDVFVADSGYCPFDPEQNKIIFYRENLISIHGDDFQIINLSINDPKLLLNKSLFCKNQEGFYGFFDREGFVFSGFCYDNIKFSGDHQDDDLFFVELNGKKGFVNHLNEIILPIEYDDIIEGDYINGVGKIGRIRKNNKYGYYYGPLKRILVPAQFDWSDHFFYFKKFTFVGIKSDPHGFNYAIMSSNGQLITEFIFNDYVRDCNVSEHETKLIPVAKTINGKLMWGFLNENATIIIDFQYDKAQCFSEGFASVAKEVKGILFWGYINSANKLVVDFKYDKAEKFSHSIAKVILKGDETYIVCHGNIIYDNYPS